MSDLAQLPADHPWVAVGAVAALLLLVRLLGRRRPRAGAPRAGEVWFAEVPFEDGSGSKDRPVLVLSTAGRSYDVARFTSQDKSGRRDHVRVPQGIPGLPSASWLNLRPTTLPRSAFRRRTGTPGGAFVAWFRDAADNQV